MIKNILLIFLLFLTGFSNAQATLFSENFEAGFGAWSFTDDLAPNTWIRNTCAGNGSSVSGTQSMYITKGGVGVGCGPTGDVQFAYDNSPSGLLKATSYTTVDATCASNLQLNFDYQINGIVAEDFGEVIYSTDGGTTWLNTTGELATALSWTNITISLPSSLDGTTFLLGFRFNYNNSGVGANPFSVDNITVTGTDALPPTMVCPSNLNLAVTVNCDSEVGDYTKGMVSLSDNCTDSVDIVVTQDIPLFTILPGGPGSSQPITLTATDESGNSTQCTITLDIIDNILPISTCPADTTIYVDVNCDGLIPDYTSFVVASDNCTSLGNLTITQSPPPSTIVNGTIIVTPIVMTITDESGNFTSCTFDSRTIDTMVATITCPIDTNLYANTNCETILGDFTAGAIISDNCTPLSSLTVTQSPILGTTISSDQVITLTVSGAIPNIDQSCTFTAFLVDTIQPIIICPIPNTLYVDNACTGLVEDYTGALATSDNCTISPTVTQTPLPNTSVTITDNITIILTSTDLSGNASQCQFTQPILDTISPSVTCPINQTENVDVNCSATIGDYSALVASTDNCSSAFTLTQSPIMGTSFVNSTMITMTLEDGNGNSSTCTFNVNPIDILPPTVTCPITTDISTDSGCQYILQDLTGTVTAADNCTPAISLTYSQSPTVSTPLPIGLNSITITVTDLSGNSDFCSYDINVIDLVAPVTTICPPNQDIYVTASCQGTLLDYTNLVTASDNCTAIGNLVLTQNPAMGTSITTSTVITITVEDESTNTTTCIFNANPIDSMVPLVTCPSDQPVAIGPSCDYSMPDLSTLVAGTDNCSILSNMTVTQNPSSGTSQNGTTAVLITLTDEAGNSSTCITNILPIDVNAPTITCPTPATVDLGIGCDFSLLNYGTMSSVLDNCSGYSIDQTPAAGTIVNPGLNSITLVVTDIGGNTDQCTFLLNVIENEVPTIVCPSNQSTCDPLITYVTPTFNDNCFSYLMQTDLSGLSSGMNFPVGTTTLEYTVSDSSGNSALCTFDIEVLDFPSAANILEDTIYLCNETSTLLNAAPITSGIGLWTVFAGQGNFNNQFANATGVNNIAFGTNIYVWEVSSATCGSLADTIVVINDQQDIQASTQDTIYSCSDNSVILQANTPLYGIGSWSTNGGGIIADINLANTTSTLVNSGWQDFVWTIKNGSCPLNSDTLRVLSMLKPNINENDTIVCIENDLISLSGTSLFVGQSALWSVISGDAYLSTPNIETTDASDFSPGTSLIMYSVSHSNCPTQTDTIYISSSLCNGFDPIIPTVFTPGNLDGKNDVFTIDFLSIAFPECRVVIFNRWGSVVFESTGYNTPWDGRHAGELLPMGTYFYRIELNDGSGDIINGDISIIN